MKSDVQEKAELSRWHRDVYEIPPHMLEFEPCPECGGDIIDNICRDCGWEEDPWHDR